MAVYLSKNPPREIKGTVGLKILQNSGSCSCGFFVFDLIFLFQWHADGQEFTDCSVINVKSAETFMSRVYVSYKRRQQQHTDCLLCNSATPAEQKCDFGLQPWQFAVKQGEQCDNHWGWWSFRKYRVFFLVSCGFKVIASSARYTWQLSVSSAPFCHRTASSNAMTMDTQQWWQTLAWQKRSLLMSKSSSLIRDIERSCKVVVLLSHLSSA